MYILLFLGVNFPETVYAPPPLCTQKIAKLHTDLKLPSIRLRDLFSLTYISEFDRLPFAMKHANGIFGMNLLQEIIETAFFTAFISEEVPVSVILVGPSGAAKSKLLKCYQEPFIHVTDSVTSSGLWDICKKDEKNQKRFLLIPDMNPTLSRRSSTSQATIANLLTLTADGTVRVDDGRPGDDKPIRHGVMGMATACTPEVYDKNARQWFALGLRRRIIPVFYTYTRETESKLQSLVRTDKIHSSEAQPIHLKFPKKSRRPSIDKITGENLEKMSVPFSVNLGKLCFFEDGIKRWTVKNVVPVSPHVTLRSLAMAHALRRGSLRVSKEDSQFVMGFIDFTDPEKPRQI